MLVSHWHSSARLKGPPFPALGQFSIFSYFQEPIGGSIPKFSVNTDGLRMTNKKDFTLSLSCPAQGYPTPSYRSVGGIGRKDSKKKTFLRKFISYVNDGSKDLPCSIMNVQIWTVIHWLRLPLLTIKQQFKLMTALSTMMTSFRASGDNKATVWLKSWVLYNCWEGICIHVSHLLSPVQPTSIF